MNNFTRNALLAEANNQLDQDESLKDAKTKEAAKKAVGAAIKGAVIPNTPVYWIAVCSIAVIILVFGLGGILVAASQGTEALPDFIAPTINVAIGALAGMLGARVSP